MASKWKNTTLGECADFLSGGTPSKSNADYWIGTVPWVSAKDMKMLRLHDVEDHISQSACDDGARLAPSGSIFMLVRGMTLHNDLPICIAMREMAFNQDLKALVAKPHVLSSFLTYWLIANKPSLRTLVDSASHGTGRIHTDVLRATEINLPPKDEQRRIADIFERIDDKIELNRSTNETLEAMAKALFKSWFVDFDPVKAKAVGQSPASLDATTAKLFPAAFEDSPLGPIPKGWRVGKVGDIAQINRDGVNPASFPDEVFDHYSIPAYDEGEQPKPELGSTIMSNKFVVPVDCVLVSKLNPRIPRVWLPVPSLHRGVCSTEFLVNIPRNEGTKEYLYCLFYNDAFTSEFATMVTGTSGSHQRVKPESLTSMIAVIPSEPVITRYTETVGPLLSHIAANREESRTLAATRDALLPKLLSGELRTGVGLS